MYHLSKINFHQIAELLGEAKSKASTNDDDPIAVHLVSRNTLLLRGLLEKH
jgi:hypothetical protein